MPLIFDFLHVLEQYLTSCQFFAHDLRQVISRPQVLQGLLGRCCLFPLYEKFLVNASSQGSLAWGRWGSLNIQDNLTVPFINALQGRSVTVGDGYYFLFRNELNVPNLLSIQQGVANFSLLNSNAYFLDNGNNISSANVSSGQLGINFSNQTFTTSLSLGAVPAAPSSSSVGTSGPAQTLQSSGKINLNSGVFLSSPGSGVSASSSPTVAGAVSLDTKQAGYIFTVPSVGGQFKGATLWGR